MWILLPFFASLFKSPCLFMISFLSQPLVWVYLLWYRFCPLWCDIWMQTLMIFLDQIPQTLMIGYHKLLYMILLKTLSIFCSMSPLHTRLLVHIYPHWTHQLMLYWPSTFFLRRVIHAVTRAIQRLSLLWLTDCLWMVNLKYLQVEGKTAPFAYGLWVRGQKITL
jgi:hypothetical protein